MSTEKSSRLDRPALQRIAETFKLFGDATRLSILQALREGPRPVNDLVEELGTSQANISKHLKLLHDGGLVARDKQGMQVFYAIDNEIIFPLCELVCGKLNEEAVAAQQFSFEI
ncbi:MAG: DNA-binding transcriptional ArsR family regulator [Verrucomicrobiales bacterium]|jgi:DNA-binding transcriptional ArsR family regulator